MNPPDEQQWLRVEQLAEEFRRLPPQQLTVRMAELATAGESPTVLTLLGTWLDLPPPPSALSAGTILGGRYVLREKIGEGGMGSVWRAEQNLISRDVAVKIIHPALVTPMLTARFAGEMKVLGQLDHPGLVRIFDAGLHEEPGGASFPFFAMELVPGQRLDLWAEARRKDHPALLHIAAAICHALGAAHERQIVHRDLKPSNVIVRPDGQPVIVDFGIARLRGLVLGEEEGVFSGTPNYAAPEQHLGRDHDFRSGESVDVYAAGALLFEMLAGRRMFDFPSGTPVAEMRRAVLQDPPPRLSSVIRDCPRFLDEIVSRAVRREPSDRFYSMAAFARAIQRCLKLLGPAATELPPWRPARGAIVPGTPWKLLEKIGEGGAGEVWTGQHDQLGERRVFKFCDSEEKTRTLKRELTLFRLLKERVGRNPHFVPLHDVSLEEPPWYLMMDYVEARDLELWTRQQSGGLGQLPEALRLEIVIQAAEALQAAHEAGILHRDIKPANLLVREEAPGKIFVLIADFGIGQLTTEELLRGETRLGFTRTVSDFRAGPLSGTMRYLAPELLEGNPATARSDIYSLGVVLWQLLAGNLGAALDPVDWPSRIDDPLLRDILHRCLAGAPSKRWAAAGELAASLRSLPEQRIAAQRRQAELAARERAAYQRGLIRASVIAGGIILVVLSLAVLAALQRREAVRARGLSALEQATALPRSDLRAGRRQRGLLLLETAARTATNRFALRTAAAAVFGMTDLAPVPPPALETYPPPPSSAIPIQDREVCRALSPSGELTAVARDLDGLNGAIDLFDSRTGRALTNLVRPDFPWIPIAEPGLFSFSLDGRQLVVGGAATSRHLLVFEAATARLRACLFHGSDPLSSAWHPQGRLIATGCADGSVRVWDLARARNPMLDAPAGHQFDLPPKLNTPTLDLPLHLLRGQRGAVRHLAFTPDGRCLAALDAAGYLRVYTGFFLDPAASATLLPDRVPPPVLAAETRLEKPDQVTSLTAGPGLLLLERGQGSREALRILPGNLPRETFVGFDLMHAAWNSAGTELCAITLTDVHFFDPASLATLLHVAGLNPKGAAWDPSTDSWLLPGDSELKSYRRPPLSGRLQPLAAFPLLEAMPGQASLTALAASRDGRAAVYRGHRLQFFSGGRAAPPGSSILTGTEGQFRELLWDAPGRLLAAVFARGDGSPRLEVWATSADFPPQIEPLAARPLPFDRLAPANDGRHLLARGRAAGLVLIDPRDARISVLDASAAARQDAPLAASGDGARVALVVDENIVRLLRLPGGEPLADLQLPRLAGIAALKWNPSGTMLASQTEDGCLQVWNLEPWHEWLAAHDVKN